MILNRYPEQPATTDFQPDLERATMAEGWIAYLRKSPGRDRDIILRLVRQRLIGFAQFQRTTVGINIHLWLRDRQADQLLLQGLSPFPPRGQIYL
jgi:hypothetical protein